MYKKIYLSKGKTSSIDRFHPWIFSGAIKSMDNNIVDGDVVKIFSESGVFKAIGHYQKGSITVRVLSFEDVIINDLFWNNRLREALQLRINLGLINSKNNIFRLVHGEGDFMPGLIIDVYDRIAVIQAHSIGMHMNRLDIAKNLMIILSGKIDAVYYKSETTLSYKEEVSSKSGFLIDNRIKENFSEKIDNSKKIFTKHIAIENGLAFSIDLEKGQKTGFFIDQRENRLLLQKYSNQKNVLNMFCYTGGFSVYALQGGAKKVVSVDSSEKAINLTKCNVDLNFNPEKINHEAYAEDAFKYLEKDASKYDIVVLDPPAFAKHKSAIKNALKGYIRLNMTALSKMISGGILFTFSCSQAIDNNAFKLAVFTAAAKAKRRVRILHQLHQPADHPINIYHPEGEYLKGFVLEVL